MNPDLAKAARALEFGDPVEARVHAWNALETIDPVEAGQLRRIAEELGDTALVAELDRRGFSVQPPGPRSPFRRRKIAVPLVILAFFLVAAVNTVPTEPGAPKVHDATRSSTLPLRSPARTPTDGVWLVRIGNSERVPLSRLAEDLTHRYDLPVEVLPKIDPLPDDVFDDEEHELDGDRLVTLLARSYAASGHAAIIGITDYPMLSADLGDRRPFMLRMTFGGYAVISTADLGANIYSRLRGHNRSERTRKLVGRGIAFVYLMRPVSTDPKSLTRSEMSGADDIDALHERL